MTRKEKAKKLVEKFEYQDNYGICENSGIKGIDLETAKQCAVKIVDDDIDMLENEMIAIDYGIRKIWIDELKKVKQEIEKL